MPKEPLEKTIVAACVAALRARGWLVWRNHGGPMARAGLPDLMALRRGVFLGCEVKRPGQHTTALQRHTLDRIEASGGLACVVTSADELLRHLEENQKEQLP